MSSQHQPEDAELLYNDWADATTHSMIADRKTAWSELPYPMRQSWIVAAAAMRERVEAEMVGRVIN